MCVEYTSFSIQINGELVDFFDGKRGLRQNVPISPLLFTIDMEYLTRLLRGLSKYQGYYHHPKCHRVDLKHIIFVDDLFLFTSGRCSAISAIKGVLEEFLACSGLSVNMDKSQIFTVGMDGSKVRWVEGLLNTNISSLPVRYLGFPLTTKSIRSADCSTIIQSQLEGWRVGATDFFLESGMLNPIGPPDHCLLLGEGQFFTKKVLKAVNSICVKFLWNGCAPGRSCHLNSWEKVCLDKKEGGLGIRNLELLNDAIILKQLWDLSNESQNLWTKMGSHLLDQRHPLVGEKQPY
ncbi:hypothetical protein QQ045_029192 [Rhodiola kirilowii]